jgi:hypothetical protein
MKQELMSPKQDGSCAQAQEPLSLQCNRSTHPSRRYRILILSFALSDSAFLGLRLESHVRVTGVESRPAMRFRSQAAVLQAFNRAMGDIALAEVKPESVLAFIAGTA